MSGTRESARRAAGFYLFRNFSLNGRSGYISSAVRSAGRSGHVSMATALCTSPSRSAQPVGLRSFPWALFVAHLRLLCGHLRFAMQVSAGASLSPAVGWRRVAVADQTAIKHNPDSGNASSAVVSCCERISSQSDQTGNSFLLQHGSDALSEWQRC